MKYSLQTTHLAVMLLLLGSCESSKKEKQDESVMHKEREVKLDSINSEYIKDLSVKYGSLSNWDTLTVYTYHFQELLINQKIPLSFEGVIVDLWQTDSKYVLKLRSYGLYESSLAIVLISKNQFLNLSAKPKDIFKESEGCFIINVTDVITKDKLVSRTVGEGEDVESYIEYDTDFPLKVFRGELIDFYLKKTISRK